MNRSAVARRCVLIAGGPLRFPLSIRAGTIPVLQGRLALFVLCLPSLFLRFRWHETKCFLGSQQVGPQDLLRLGADGNESFASVVLHFVGCRPIDPHIARSINVDGTQVADIFRPAPGQTLRADHIGHDERQVR